MNIIKQSFRVWVLCLAGVFAAPAQAAQTDIFLVYLGADKALQKSVKAALPSDLKVKSYNASLLAMADYSGKQKAVSKLSSAKLVVMITDKPAGLFGDHEFANAVVVNGSEAGDIDRIKAALH